MVDEEKDVRELSKKNIKPSKRKYEIILVSETYLVYKGDQGNVWMKIDSNKEYKVGDAIEV